MKCSNKNCKYGELSEEDFHKHRGNERYKECKYCRTEKYSKKYRERKEFEKMYEIV